MTPKEKAKQLVNTYIDIENKFNVDLFCDECGIERAAKYCALIAIDEMIIQNGELYLNGLDMDYYRKKNAFLFEVKEEIEKL